MGALVNSEQRADVQEKVDHLLASGCQIRLGGKADLQARRILPTHPAVLPAAGRNPGRSRHRSLWPRRNPDALP